jgi:hypothetical protein
MRFTIPILFLSIGIQMTSCGIIMYAIYSQPQRTTVYKDSNSKLNYLAIKTVTNERCNFIDIYAEKYENGHKTYQFSYGCSRFTIPGKTTYKYDANGNVIKTVKYTFADSGNDRVTLDETDLLVIYLIDSIRSKQLVDPPECKICTKSITALRLLPE